MHSSRSYYPPDPYAVQQQGQNQYGSISYPSSQHNHPTYYGEQGSQHQQAAPPPPSGSYYDQNYSQTHHPSSQGQSYHHQHHTESVYGSTSHQPAQNSYYGAQQQQQHEMGYSHQPAAAPQQSLPPPASAAQPSAIKTKPSPFGATGPYGIDAQNSSLDYYRRLYYPYDPITGEYMKDATPPGGGEGGSSFPGPDTSSTRPYASGTGGYGAAMNDTMNGGWNANATSVSASGQMMMMNAATAAAAAAAGGANLNPYMIRPYQENDSLLLCCDFLIPRPSINCLIIALFTMLVLIVIFTVVKFTIIYPAVDKSHQETLILVDQITVILLLCALAALIWIFGIYFTSRRTRRQISSLLSCTSASPHTSSSSYNRRMMRAGYPPTHPGLVSGYSSGGAYQTTLVNDSMQYNNQYSNSRNYDSNYSNRNSHYPGYV